MIIQQGIRRFASQEKSKKTQDIVNEDNSSEWAELMTINFKLSKDEDSEPDR